MTAIRYIWSGPARNLVNPHAVSKGYGSRSVLHDVTLGINEGERIGVVGDNGAGKSTLMRLLAGAEAPDEGAATHTTGLHAVLVGQRVDLDPESTVRAELVGGRPDHEWARDAALREVLDGLLGGVD